MTKYSPILQHSEWRSWPDPLSYKQRAVAKSGVHVSQREELKSSLSLYFKTDLEFERGGRDDKGIGQRHLSSHRRSGPNLIKGCLALPKGVKCKWQSPEESFGTDSLTSPPAADRTRASIYSTALTVTEKTGTGCSYSSERGIFAFLLATRIGKVSVVIGAESDIRIPPRLKKRTPIQPYSIPCRTAQSIRCKHLPVLLSPENSLIEELSYKSDLNKKGSNSSSMSFPVQDHIKNNRKRNGSPV
ncbi:hypothetical protein CR513_00085, partial [Mucuna pruriens]